MPLSPVILYLYIFFHSALRFDHARFHLEPSGSSSSSHSFSDAHSREYAQLSLSDRDHDYLAYEKETTMSIGTAWTADVAVHSTERDLEAGAHAETEPLDAGLDGVQTR